MCTIYVNLKIDYLKGSVTGFLTSLVKNGEIRPSRSWKKSTQFLKGTTRDLFQRILETKMRELEKHQANIFQVSIHSGAVLYQLSYQANWDRRGHGFESRSSLNFFQAFFSQLLKLRSNCEDLSSIWSFIRSSNICFIYLHSFKFTSCCWLYENVSSPFFPLLKTYLSLRKRKELVFTVSTKFWADVLPKKTLDFFKLNMNFWGESGRQNRYPPRWTVDCFKLVFRAEWKSFTRLYNCFFVCQLTDKHFWVWNDIKFAWYFPFNCKRFRASKLSSKKNVQ